MPVQVNIEDNPTYDLMAFTEARAFAEEIALTLMRHYADQDWLIQVNKSIGIANVLLPGISKKYGMQINLDTCRHDLERKSMLAGGELLERFKQKGHGATDPSNILVDAHGDAINAVKGEL